MDCYFHSPYDQLRLNNSEKIERPIGAGLSDPRIRPVSTTVTLGFEIFHICEPE